MSPALSSTDTETAKRQPQCKACGGHNNKEKEVLNVEQVDEFSLRLLRSLLFSLPQHVQPTDLMMKDKRKGDEREKAIIKVT